MTVGRLPENAAKVGIIELAPAADRPAGATKTRFSDA